VIIFNFKAQLQTKGLSQSCKVDLKKGPGFQTQSSVGETPASPSANELLLGAQKKEKKEKL
jgi:hypothetical protein